MLAWFDGKRSALVLLKSLLIFLLFLVRFLLSHSLVVREGRRLLVLISAYPPYANLTLIPDVVCLRLT